MTLLVGAAAANPTLIPKPAPLNGTGQEAGYSADVFGDYSLMGAYMIAGRFEDSGGAYLFENGNRTPRQLLKLDGSVTVNYQNFTRSAQNAVVPGAKTSCTFTAEQVKGMFLGSRVALSNTWAALAGNDLGNGSSTPYQPANCAGVSGTVPTVFLSKKNAASANLPFGALNYSVTVPFRDRVWAMDMSETDLVLVSPTAGAYVYSYDAATDKWNYNTTLLANEKIGDDFGDLVSIDGNKMVIGDSDDDDVYVFQKQGNTWSQLTSYHSNNSSKFGRAVKISGSHVVVAGESGVDFLKLEGNALNLQRRDWNFHPTYVAISFPYATAFGQDMNQTTRGVTYEYDTAAQAWQPRGYFGDFNGSPTWYANNLNMSGNRVVSGYKSYNSGTTILIGSIIFDDSHVLFPGNGSVTDTAEQARIWRNDGPYDWRRYSGSSPTVGTGPSSGAGGSANYYYVETSPGGANLRGDQAILVSDALYATPMVLDFDFHMRGTDIGQLYVEAEINGVWTATGVVIDGQQTANLNNAWQHRSVDLSGYAGLSDPIRLRFRYVADGGSLGDVALDNIRLMRN